MDLSILIACIFIGMIWETKELIRLNKLIKGKGKPKLYLFGESTIEYRGPIGGPLDPRKKHKGDR